MKNLFLLLALSLITLPAFARDGGEISVGLPPGSHKDVSEELLNHSVVQGAVALINAGHGGSCRMPAKEDILWMCTGAIPPVKEPTIFPSSCGFSFAIDCEDKMVTFNGRTQSYFLASPKPNKVKPTEKEVIFDSISVTLKR